MKGSSVFVFSYFIDGLVQYFVEPIARIFGPDDNIYPEMEYNRLREIPYSKWMES